MSADSLRKQSKQGYHGQVILPQPINDLSLIESVAGFIHEVVPQAYSSVLPGDSRDGILWARFDSTDYNDPENFPQLSECESDATPPLLLVLGYSTGVQVWSVGGSGEATELLSWCQGAVRALRFLLRPETRDPHSAKRPLVAIVDSSSPGPQFSTLSFISLKTAEVVKIIKFNSPICDVHCNKKSVVVTFSERIAVFDSATLEDRLTITTCYLSPGNSPNPIALGTRWLAYGEKRLTTWQRSSGGCEGDGAQSYTSAVIHAAKSLGKGLRELGGSLTGSIPQSSHNAQAQPGIVSIIDIERKSSTNEEDRGNMIAHFVAHTSAVVAMAFDPSGLLLVTADKHGHRFNVFRIHPHPCTAQLAAVHHLYVLHRGETTARVQDIAISWDSRWVAVSSVRGTTHVFPITPYGGLVTVRTHTTPHVVNKLSRFERSAGLRDGRGSPLPCEAPTTPPPPRLPPYPHPSVVTPLAQLRARPDDAPLAASFGPPRAWLPGRPKSKRTCADSLYIIYSSGAFMQYDLDPKVVQGVPKEKVSFDTPIELGIDAKAEWLLPKPPYTSSLCPPLPLGHVLLDLPPRSHPPADKWLSQVEIVTHTGPHRRLWMGPQFTFKSIDPLPLSGGEGEGGPDGGNPLRSNPVNMPHRPYLLVEIGSGSPQMAEVDEAGGRLREDLADAMQETQNSSGQAKGKLRRAEVEWQVNPLGAVQTHPAALHSHWPHPIFFEPYSQEHYRGLQQSLTQKNVDAALERLKQQDQLFDSNTQHSPVEVKSTTSAEEKSFKPEDSVEVCQVTEYPEPIGLETLTTVSVNVDSDVNKDPFENVEEPLEEKTISLGTLPSTSHLLEVESTTDIPVDIPLKTNIASDIETSNPEDSSSKKQESEEKICKPSGKKSRKKRNGNDKKTKKESIKQSNEDKNPSSLMLELREPHEKKQPILKEEAVEPFIEENIKVDVSSTEDPLLLIEKTQSVLACGVIEVNEDKALPPQEQVFPFVEIDARIEESDSKVHLMRNESDPQVLDFSKEELIVDVFETREGSDLLNISDSKSSSGEKSMPEDDAAPFESEYPLDKIGDEPFPSEKPNLISIDSFNPSQEITEELDDRDLNGNTTITDPLVEEVATIDITTRSPIDLISGSPVECSTSVEPENEAIISSDSNYDNSNKNIVLAESHQCMTEENDPHVSEEIDSTVCIEKDPIEVDTSINSEITSHPHIESCAVIEVTSDASVLKSETDLVSSNNEPETTEESDAVLSVNESPQNTTDESSPSVIVVEQESDDFITVPSKSSRSKNRRRKKEKMKGDAGQPDVIEKEPSEPVVKAKDEEVLVEISSTTVSELVESEAPLTVEIPPCESVEMSDLTKLSVIEENVKEEENYVSPTSEITSSMECSTDKPAVTVFIPEDIQSDHITSTDKSEIEDVSSHSGKESDDSKITKKERSRRQKRSESSDKDRTELKKKSPSPSATKPETKESESSDEAEKTSENKQCVPKVPKRKKGKKSEDLLTECPIKTKENSPQSTDVDESRLNTSKDEDKSLNSSSVESNSENRVTKHVITRSWSHSASSSEHQNGIEDRDSVYESCNDDGASDSLAFESSKEDFDEVSSKTVITTEPSSSNTEERTDSCEKNNQPLKKVRKQKKKKR